MDDADRRGSGDDSDPEPAEPIAEPVSGDASVTSEADGTDTGGGDTADGDGKWVPM